jgi:hypothetical protein
LTAFPALRGGSSLFCHRLVGSHPGRFIPVTVTLVIVFLAAAFHHLTIVADGGRPAIR